MARFDLKITTLGKILPEWMPRFPLRIPDPDDSLSSLEELFLAASDGKVLLNPDFDGALSGAMSSVSQVWASDLQAQLWRITGNQRGVWPVPCLGLVYAPSWAASKSVYGLMFDRGFSESVDPVDGEHFHSAPREGCAVFLGAISSTGLAADQYQKQVAFTTVHELGHVFNLQEQGAPPCFLNSSHLEGPVPAAFTFLEHPHKDRLKRVDFDRMVAPGGACFGDTGVWANADLPVSRRKPVSVPLKLEAGIMPAEFWPWEPVELDIRITAGAGKRGEKLRVPNCLDAGYRCFEIWIEDPTGERRKYRAPRHYCAYPSFIDLEPGQTWRRDISIFCEAGGYTFRRSGRHLIWVKFVYAPDVEAVSPIFEIMIKPWPSGDRRSFARLEELEFLLRRARRLLYHRNGGARRQEIDILGRLASHYQDEPTGGAALYALGRFRAAQAFRTRRKAPLREASELLKRSAQHEALSGQRRAKAQQVLDQISVM